MLLDIGYWRLAGSSDESKSDVLIVIHFIYSNKLQHTPSDSGHRAHRINLKLCVLCVYPDVIAYASDGVMVRKPFKPRGVVV